MAGFSGSGFSARNFNATNNSSRNRMVKTSRLPGNPNLDFGSDILNDPFFVAEKMSKIKEPAQGYDFPPKKLANPSQKFPVLN